MSFSEKIIKIEALMKDKFQKGEYDAVSKLSSGMVDIAKSQFPKEFNDLLIKAKILDDIKVWRDTSSQFLMEAGSLEINPYEKKVYVELNSAKLESPMIEVQNYVNAIPGLVGYEKTLLTSFLTTPDIHSVFQVYHCFFL